MKHRTPMPAALVVALSTAVAHADITNLTQGTTHPTIQDAIDLSVDGDEIVVDPGEYFENLDLQGRLITLRSQDPTDAGIVISTIINGGGVGTTITCDQGETTDTLIAGFLITGGYTTLSGGGMSVLNASPTIRHCTFTNNEAINGGGLFIGNDAPMTVADCTISHNTSLGAAGMSVGGNSVTLVNCAFHSNTAGFGNGGGLFISGEDTTVTDCTFLGNSTGGSGGGLVLAGDACEVRNSLFSGNSTASDVGGGVRVFDTGTDVILVQCRLVENSATAGGGLFIDAGAGVSLEGTAVCANTADQIQGSYTDLGGNAESTFIAPPASPVNPCPEDINSDGVINQQDLGALLAVYDQNCP